jgi:hypothetical protein
MYDLIQSALTNLTQLTAIAGLGGIAAHAFWKQHKHFMTEFCPSVGVQPIVEDVETIAPTEPAVTPQPEQPVVEDVWEAPISSSPARYWMRRIETTKPALMLCPAAEEKQPKKTRKAPAKPKAPKAPAKPRTTRKRKAA